MTPRSRGILCARVSESREKLLRFTALRKRGSPRSRLERKARNADAFESSRGQNRSRHTCSLESSSCAAATCSFVATRFDATEAEGKGIEGRREGKKIGMKNKKRKRWKAATSRSRTKVYRSKLAIGSIPKLSRRSVFPKERHRFLLKSPRLSVESFRETPRHATESLISAILRDR